MSTTALSCEHYLIYCHVDGSCSLKQDIADARTHQCANLIAAVALVRDLKTRTQMHLTIYDPVGKILMQSLC
jgi:hypothetical protein